MCPPLASHPLPLRADPFAPAHWQACGEKLDHGVLIVGMTADAYIVKNSWGPTWGVREPN